MDKTTPTFKVGDRLIQTKPDHEIEYVVEKVWRHKAQIFADLGWATLRARVFIQRVMDSPDWRIA